MKLIIKLCFALTIISSVYQLAFAGPSIGQRIDNTTNYVKLKSKVLAALTKKGLPIESIATNINGDTVQLCGFLNTTEGEAAVQTTQSVSGVKKVINGIVYTDSMMIKLSTDENGGYFSNSKITAVVKTQLLLKKAVLATDINVQTYRGIVNLCGFVENKNQQSLAINTAQKTEGVRKVLDNLIIEK